MYTHDRQRTARLAEVSSVLQIADDCEFVERWKNLGADASTYEHSEAAAHRKSKCFAKTAEDLLAIRDDCEFSLRWKVFRRDGHPLRHLASERIELANERIETCEALERRERERETAVPFKSTHENCMLWCRGVYNSKPVTDNRARTEYTKCSGECDRKHPNNPKQGTGREIIRLPGQ